MLLVLNSVNLIWSNERSATIFFECLNLTAELLVVILEILKIISDGDDGSNRLVAHRIYVALIRSRRMVGRHVPFASSSILSNIALVSEVLLLVLLVAGVFFIFFDLVVIFTWNAFAV